MKCHKCVEGNRWQRRQGSTKKNSTGNKVKMNAPVYEYSSTCFGDHKCLDATRVGDMRAHTEIDHGTATVDRGARAIWDFALNELSFVFVVLCMVESVSTLEHGSEHLP